MRRLFIDAHVKAAITAGLRRRGIDVVIAQEDGGTRLKDTEGLGRATALQRVLCRQDDDLLAIAHARQTARVCFAGLIDGPQLAATMGTDGLELDVVGQV
jgi:predicted nuclease of predicted toxin-antitoxin system